MNKKPFLDARIEPADSTTPASVTGLNGAPVYHGFPVIPETVTEGWMYGATTEFIGAEAGDGYVVAPDGSHAGLVWEVGEGSFTEILPPEPERWGVYAVWFPRPVRTIEDLIANFRAILPDLKAAHAKRRLDRIRTEIRP